MLNNMISRALGREGDPYLVRVCLFLLEIPGAVALQEQCSTVHAMISIMYRDALRLGFALRHRVHPSAALNSTHYTLGLEIGDQQTKLNIVCVLCVCLCECMCLSVYWSESVLLCVDETLGAGHAILLPRAHSSLFSPFMCEIDCAICAIQMDELMPVPLMGVLGLSLVLLPTQAEKEKLQQAGDGNFERILLLAPQQPISK